MPNNRHRATARTKAKRKRQLRNRARRAWNNFNNTCAKAAEITKRLHDNLIDEGLILELEPTRGLPFLKDAIDLLEDMDCKACKLPDVAIIGEPSTPPKYMRAAMESLRLNETLAFVDLPKPKIVDGESYQDVIDKGLNDICAGRIASPLDPKRFEIKDISDKQAVSKGRFLKESLGIPFDDGLEVKISGSHFVPAVSDKIQIIMRDEVDKDNENKK